MREVDLRGLRPGRVLLVKPSSLGDVVDALPVAVGLRRRYPEAHVAWLVKPEYAALVACSPAVDEVIHLPAAGGVIRRWGGLRQAIRAVRQGGFDLAVDLQGLFRSAWLAWRGRVPLRLGLSSAREGAGLFYTHTVRVPTMEMHAVDRYWLAAAALGCDGAPPAADLKVPAEASLKAKALLAAARDVGQPPSAAASLSLPGRGEGEGRGVTGARKPAPHPALSPEGRGAPPPQALVVLLPGARWRTKCWPPERFAAVADVVVERAGARVAIAGSEQDRPAARIIRETARNSVVDLTGRTSVVELAAILVQAALVVAVDTGPAHLAAALGRPVVAVFGPTNPVRTGPYGAGHAVVTAQVPCRPCYRRRCGDLRCLEAVSAEEVSEAALEILGRLG